MADAVVFGVVIDGEARAYPHNVGWWHEIVNDQINGQGSHDTLAGNQGVDVINGFASEINENFTFYQSWVDSV